MVSKKQLAIAEAIKAGKTQDEVVAELKTSSRTFSNVNKLMKSGAIAFTEDGTAYESDVAEVEETATQIKKEVGKERAERVVRETTEDFTIMSELRLRYQWRAAEAEQTLQDYMMDALVFYVDNKDRVDEMEKEMKMLRFLKNTAMEFARRDLVHVTKMDYFYKFVRYCLHLRSQGMAIPPGVVDSFWSDLTNLGEIHERVINSKA